MASEDDLSKPPIVSGPFIATKLTEAQWAAVVQLYAESAMPVDQIAKQFGISESLILAVVEDRGMPLRPRSPADDYLMAAPPTGAGLKRSTIRRAETTSQDAAEELEGGRLLTHGTRRINVNFSDQAYGTLEDLARRTGKSMSDVLRDAITLKAWFEQTRAEGGHVLVERPDGKVREVISV